MLAPFARRVCLAFPLAGPRRARATASPVARSPFSRRDRARRARAPRASPPRRRACSSSAARSARARSTSPRSRRSPAPPSTCCTSAGAATIPELAARERPAGYDLREYLDLEAFADALAACDLVVARAGGSVFEIAAHARAVDPRALPARRRRPSERQRALDGAGGRRRRDRRLPSSSAGASAARGGRAARRSRRACARWRAAAASLARPDAAGEVARELLEAAR